jgi:hypothetical protein
MDDHVLAILDLDQHIEGGRRFAFEHTLLRAATPRLLVRQSDRLDATHQVAQSGVVEQIVQCVAVRGADQLHTALGDGACGDGFQFAPDLVDDNHLRHVIFHRLDHHLVLLRWVGHLHAASAADGRVRDITITCNLIAGVDDDGAAILTTHTRGFAQQGGLANAWPPKQENALVAHHNVFDDLDGAIDGAPDTTGEANNLRPCGCGLPKCGAAYARCQRDYQRRNRQCS